MFADAGQGVTLYIHLWETVGILIHWLVGFHQIDRQTDRPKGGCGISASATQSHPNGCRDQRKMNRINSLVDPRAPQEVTSEGVSSVESSS